VFRFREYKLCVCRFTVYSSSVQFLLPLIIISVVYINIYEYLKVTVMINIVNA
jgi:hypothetical protein